MERFLGAFDEEHLGVIRWDIRDGGGEVGVVCTCFGELLTMPVVPAAGAAVVCAITYCQDKCYGPRTPHECEL